MHVSAIVLAAGKGLRFASGTSKPLAKINSQPIIVYSLETLSKHPSIREIIVVVNNKNSKKIMNKIREYAISKVNRVVEGGRRRQDSVRNGLGAIDAKTDLVLIHDAARPFIEKKTLSSVIKEAYRYGAAIVGVPVKETIKKVKGQRSKVNPSASLRIDGERSRTIKVVQETIDRTNLWQIQTPQVFRKDLILRAYQKFGHIAVTDDAALVEKLGAPVAVVMGSYRNIKITTLEDLAIAEAILKTRKFKL